MPDPAEEPTRPISVAELLARHGSDPSNARSADTGGGRRRRGSGGGLSVSELTGEIPVVRDTRHHSAPDVAEDRATIPPEPQPEIPAPTPVPDPAPIPDPEPEPTPAPVPDPQPVRPEPVPEVPEPPTIYTPREPLEVQPEDPSADTVMFSVINPGAPWSPKDLEAPVVEYPITGPMPIITPPAPAPASAPAAAPAPVPQADPASQVPTEVLVAPAVAPEATPDLAAETVAIPVAEEPTTESETMSTESDEHPNSMRQWLVLGGQAAIGVLLGAALFTGFGVLWQWQRMIALILAILVIVALVAAVRVLRRDDDIVSTMIAVAVGIFVTFGPLAFLLSVN